MPAPNRPGPRGPIPNPQAGQATKGPLHAVPCPWCRKPLDFRENADESMGGAGWGSDGGLETGAQVNCDHCGRLCKIIAVERVTLVTLAPAR